MKITTDKKYLSNICKPLNIYDSIEIAKKMKLFLLSNKNIERKTLGLACNQLRLKGRVILVRNHNNKFLTYINPRIVWKSDVTIVNQEECLSVPKKQIDVVRHLTIWIKDDHQCCGAVEFCGQEALILQHEIDHLNGILID